MKFKIILFLYFPLVCCFSLRTQNTNDIEVLKQELSVVVSQKNKAELLKDIAKAYSTLNGDSSYHYSKKLISLGELMKDDNVLAQGYQNIGISLKELGNLDEAASFLIKALTLRERNEELVNAEFSRLSLGNVYLEQGDILWQQWEDTLAMELFEKADGMYHIILENALQTNDSNLISKTYHNLGASAHRLENYEEALSNFDLAHLWCPAENKLERKHELTMNELAPLMELGRTNDAEKLLKESKTHFQKNGMIEPWIRCNFTMSEYYWESEPAKCQNLLLEIDSLAAVLNNAGYRIESNTRLYELNKDLGNFELALEYLEDQSDLSSSVMTSETAGAIEELNLKYNTEKTEKELLIEKSEKAKANAKNLILSIVLIAVIVLLVLGALFFIQRQKTKDLKQEKQINQLLQDQEIATLQSTLEGQDKERKRIAQDLHDRLGSRLTAVGMYMEASYDSTDSDLLQDKALKELQNAIKETREIAYDLETGILSKFGLLSALYDLKNKLSETQSLNLVIIEPKKMKRFDSEKETGVYRVIQEIINNALKHSGASEIILKIEVNNSILKLETKDNGIGFDSEKKAVGMGLKNIKSRINKLKGKLDIQSGKGIGTIYKIEFNIDNHGH